MRFGYCADMNHADQVARAGFDYIECPAAGIYAMSDDEFKTNLQILRDSGIHCESTNLFLPRSIMIYETDRDTVIDYFERTFDRLGRLNIKACAFGSGGARRVPKTMTVADAEARFVEFTHLAAELALPYGFTIALEPLNFRETNFMLTMEDGYDLARRVDMDNVGVLMDLFHFAFELKSMDDLAKWKDKIAHVHIAEPFSRAMPRRGQYDYAPLFAALDAIGYSGLVSVEAKPMTDDTLREAIAVLWSSV